MKYFVFTLLSLLLSTASALSPVVRVDLSACHMPGAAVFSGVLLADQGKNFVVTSSWAQFSSQWQGPRCEKIWSEQGELSVRPVVTDHLAGLALYEVQSLVQGLTAPAGTADATQVWMLGGQGLVSFQGDIVITGSRRHHIPLWDRTLEWLGEPVSAGALGAGVWSNGQWQGIVSHEYLELVPGAKTRTLRWNLKKATSQDHLIVVSAKDVLSWVQKQKARLEESVLWRVEDQRAGLDRWIVGDLELTALCPDETDTNPGGQYPIGGNDGVGIGGDSILNKACKMHAVLASEKSPWMPLSLQNWQTQAPPSLMQKQDVFLWYGLSRGSQGLVRDYVFSAESFIKSALDEKKKWVDQIPSLTPPKELLALVQSAQALQNESMNCYSRLFIREQNVQELTRKLFFFSMLAQSQAWHELRPDDVATVMDLKGLYAQGWKALLWEPTCGSPKIRQVAEAFASEQQKAWAP